MGIAKELTTTGVGTVTISLEKLDMNDLLFVVDQGTDKIQVRSRDNLGLIAQLGGTGSGDAQFDTPTHCAQDQYAVYVVDQANDRVKKHVGTSLAYHNEYDTSSDIPNDANFIHVDRRRQVIGRKDTNATVYIRHKNTPFGEEQTAIDCGAGAIAGLAVIQDYFYVGNSTAGNVKKFALAGGAAVATWSGVPVGFAVASLCTDGTYVYALCTKAATDSKVVRLYADDLHELDTYDLTGYQLVVDICVDDDRLYLIDTAAPTLDAVEKDDGSAIAAITAQTDMTTPSGVNCLPSYFDDYPQESVATGSGTATHSLSGSGVGADVDDVGEGTASHGFSATGTGSAFAKGSGTASHGFSATGTGSVDTDAQVGTHKVVNVTHDNSGVPVVDATVVW